MRKTTLDLSPHQVKQAETQKTAADGVVTARLPETYQWLLVPTQANPQAPVTWQTIRLSGQDALAERASKKLRTMNRLSSTLPPRACAWRWTACRYGAGTTLQSASSSRISAATSTCPVCRPPPFCLNAIRAGLALLTWEHDAFAYAESYDESAARYRGLHSGAQISVTQRRHRPAREA